MPSPFAPLHRFVVAAGWGYVLLLITPVAGALAPAVNHGLDLGLTPHGPSGSGDTGWAWLVEWTRLSMTVGVGLGVAAVPRPVPRWATSWLIEGLRLYLAYKLIIYGLAKTAGTQMPAPSVAELHVPLGELSPMRLMWIFFGYSPAYQTFTGAAEVVFGLLLASRRTATLGALGSAGVMSNIFLMNLCYDVPVKMLSGRMLLFSLLLLAADARPFITFFFSDRAIAPRPLRPQLPGRAARAWRVAKVLGLVAMTAPAGVAFRQADLQWASATSATSPPHLAGAWEVVEGPVGWTHVIFDWGSICVRTGEGPSWAVAHVDGDRLVLERHHQTIGSFDISWHDDEPTLMGTLHDQEVTVRLADRRRLEDFPLNAQGFRWIWDAPTTSPPRGRALEGPIRSDP